MRHPKIVIAGIGLALAAAGGATATVATASPSGGTPSASTSQGSGPGAAAATVRTAQALVGGRTETILVNAAGLPLYYYRPDTAATSLVAGGLAVAWPPLTSAAPTATGVNGRLTVVKDAHGSQVAYNGHLLYTFVSDRAGQVTGQGVQDFFVATPGIAPITGTSAPAETAPAAPPGGGYGY
jgi:predicted lipoprotein with Yx(FWY)xxD motif